MLPRLWRSSSHPPALPNHHTHFCQARFYTRAGTGGKLHGDLAHQTLPIFDKQRGVYVHVPLIARILIHLSEDPNQATSLDFSQGKEEAQIKRQRLPYSVVHPSCFI